MLNTHPMHLYLHPIYIIPYTLANIMKWSISYSVANSVQCISPSVVCITAWFEILDDNEPCVADICSSLVGFSLNTSRSASALKGTMVYGGNWFSKCKKMWKAYTKYDAQGLLSYRSWMTLKPPGGKVAETVQNQKKKKELIVFTNGKGGG